VRTTLIAATFVALPLLAACGGGSDAVTTADLSKSMQDKGLQDAALADCAAQLYVDSGISEEGLQAMVNEGEGAQVQSGQPVDPATLGMSEEDSSKATEAANKIVSECIGQK